MKVAVVVFLFLAECGGNPAPILDQSIYLLHKCEDDGMDSTKKNCEKIVKGVQNSSLVYQGSLATVIDKIRPVGSFVLNVKSWNVGTRQPRRFYYKLLTNPMDYFYLNSITGELRTARALTNAPGLISLSIKVIEGVSTAIVQVLITIKDVNDSPPEINKEENFVSSVENTTTTTSSALEIESKEASISTISTTLQASDEHSTIRETIITEKITTKSHTTSEQVKEVKFYTTVADTYKPQLTSTTEIIVDNMNDNGPYFSKPEYNFDVLENSPRGTVVGKVEAKYKDLGIYGEITFSLVGKDSENFVIDPDTGILAVANSSFLDRERISTVTLSVLATDKAPVTMQKTNTSTINIKILDINDNAPQFKQNDYFLLVPENVAVNPSVELLQVQAEDKDEDSFGDVRYFITSGNDEELFRLDNRSGALYPKKRLLGKGGKYVLIVKARDGVGAGPHSDKATVTVVILEINSSQFLSEYLYWVFILLLVIIVLFKKVLKILRESADYDFDSMEHNETIQENVIEKLLPQ